MNRAFPVLARLCAAATFACMIASAQDNAPAKPKPPRKPNPVLAQIEDVAGLPRVLLIGDSISMGYTLPTRKLLEGKANVHRIPTNGGPTSRGVESMTKWLGDGTWDVIHFNWGLHDLKRMDDGKHQIAIEDYEKNLRTLVAQLKETGATLIWASTTPVPDAEMKPPRSNEDVIRYNEVAAKIMADNEIQIDDIYAFCLPQLTELQRPANVHFTPQGSAELAKQVAKVIEAALPAK